MKDRWYPERFFYSHASSDGLMTSEVTKALQDGGAYEVYVAERRLAGKPLMHKLKEELLDCNAILVGWTQEANRKSTSEIVSFELGMAFSLGLPIYLMRFNKAKAPWFFDKLTDYTDLCAPTEVEVKAAIARIEPFSFYHPIDVECRPEIYTKKDPNVNASRNVDVVQPDGAISLPKGFDGILQFCVCNRRLRSERDVRLLLQFPDEIEVTFNAGQLDDRDGLSRNDVFYMWQRSHAAVEIHWPSLAPRDIVFELRLGTAGHLPGSGKLTYRLSSEAILGWRSKTISLCWC